MDSSKKKRQLSHFQNSVSADLRSDENGFRKTVLKAGFSNKSKVAFPITEVLEKPQEVINEEVGFNSFIDLFGG